MGRQDRKSRVKDTESATSYWTVLEHQVLDKGVKVTEYLTVHLGLDTVGIGEPWHVSGRWESNQIFLYHSGPSRKNRFFRCLIWK